MNRFGQIFVTTILSLLILPASSLATATSGKPPRKPASHGGGELKPTKTEKGTAYSVPISGKTFGEVTLSNGCKVTVHMSKTKKKCGPGNNSVEYEVKVTWSCPPGGASTSSTSTVCGSSTTKIQVNDGKINVGSGPQAGGSGSWADSYGSTTGPSVSVAQ